MTKKLSSDKLLLLAKVSEYIKQNGYQSNSRPDFLNGKTLELQNWADYQDLTKGLVIFRHSGIRITSLNCYPALTFNSGNIPLVYKNNQWSYLTQQTLLSLQSFPPSYQFPVSYSLNKVYSLLGNSVNVKSVQYFWQQQRVKASIKFIDLFAGIGGFHCAFKNQGECILAVDNNKNAQQTYQLNFPQTPFLLGDINDQQIQAQILNKDFDLLCAGFPCQPFSKASNNKQKEVVINSLLNIIEKKKPQYLLLENVVQLTKHSFFLTIINKLSKLGYYLNSQIINAKDLGVKQNRERLFIYASQNRKQIINRQYYLKNQQLIKKKQQERYLTSLNNLNKRVINDINYQNTEIITNHD